jgi:hypothetical protein
MLKEVFSERDQSAWWLTVLDYLDRSLEKVATPDRIEDTNAALDSGVVDHDKVYEAVGAVYFEEDGRPVTIEPVAGSYTIHSDQSGSFAYRVEDDVITIRSIPTAWSMEGEIVYQLSSKKEGRAWEVVLSSEYNPHDHTITADFSSIVTGYVESRSGKFNTLDVQALRDPETGDWVRLSRRDSAVLCCYYKAAERVDPKLIVVPASNDFRLIVYPTPHQSVKESNKHHLN